MTRTLKYDCTIYFLLVLLSAIYWANNFSKFTTYKGDEFFFFAEYLLGLTMLFYLIQIISARRLKYLLLLIFPLLTTLTSVILGLGVLALTSMNGTPSETIYVYGFVYSLTNILLMLFLLTRLTNRQKFTKQTFDTD